MRKLVFLCRRRPDLPPARYVELLLGGHVPIAMAHHPTLREYVVNVVESVPPGAPELDSIGELSFDTLEDYRTRLYDSPEGEAIVRRDVARFMGGADAYATTEHVQKDTTAAGTPGVRSPGVKLVCPLVRRPGLTHEAFVDHWLGRHVPLARAHHPGLVKYVTNVVDERLSPTGEPWDGIAELHFASAEDATSRMFDSAEGERLVREDIARFIGRAMAYRVAEWVQKRPDGAPG
jgi:uncharacterized protein (TIGR02118 family)